MAERGVAGFLMSDVAGAAGVGVGTVYRRCGDRAGLAYALPDEQGREMQAAFVYGRAPCQGAVGERLEPQRVGGNDRRGGRDEDDDELDQADGEQQEQVEQAAPQRGVRRPGPQPG